MMQSCWRLQAQEQLIESQKAHNLCKHDLETCLHQCALPAVNSCCQSHCATTVQEAKLPVHAPFALRQRRSLTNPSCYHSIHPSSIFLRCSTNLHSDSTAEMDKELTDMQHRIAAHETRVSAAFERASSASNLRAITKC